MRGLRDGGPVRSARALAATILIAGAIAVAGGCVETEVISSGPLPYASISSDASEPSSIPTAEPVLEDPRADKGPEERAAAFDNGVSAVGRAIAYPFRALWALF